MAYEVEKRTDYDALRMASAFSPVTTVVDSSGQQHQFRKFQWLDRWGICNGDKTKIIVRAKSNYHYASILLYSQVLVAGNTDYGWDVYSLTGKLLQHYSKISISKLTRYLDEKKHNN